MWAIRTKGACRGFTTPLAFLWRVDGVNLPGHGAPCSGWLVGFLPGRHGPAREFVREHPTEAPMNRQRTRREARAMASAVTGRYGAPRRQRRKVGRSMAANAARKTLGSRKK